MIGGVYINIIEQLYYDNLELQSVQNEMSPRLKKKLNELATAEEELMKTLDSEQKDLLQKYSEISNEFCTMSCANTFIVAVKFAMRFAHEVFVD